MRRSLVLLMAALTIATTRPWAAPRCGEHDPTVTVRIHDYEHLPPGWLSRASDIVTGLYADIGVRIEWFDAIRPDVRQSASQSSRTQIAQLTVNVLTPKMAARGQIREGILGFAAVAPQGQMGHIAWVVYERIRALAAEGPTDQVELLGFVIAHETGHLLMGPGSGSQTGLMKCHWDRGEMRRLNTETIGFSELQASRIRDTVMNHSPAAVAVGTAGSDAATACAATPRDDVSVNR